MKHSVTFIFLCAFLFIQSCKKDSPATPEIPNEEEVITTLLYTLIPANGVGDTVHFSFKDLDGPGGNPPEIQNGILDTATTYLAQVKLLNELVTPAEDITLEVEEEGDDHQFFYSFDFDHQNFSYTDMDSDGMPIGITSTVSTLSANTGTCTIILRHLPNKFAPGVVDGVIDNAGGESDIEVTFNVVVQ